ncbi:MAG: polyamine aminopropyltransferase [Ignavibacteria bacterium]
MSSLGKHILVEFLGCNPDIMNDVSKIESAMVEAAENSGATVINSTFHHFSPYGVSGVVVIQESHLAIHTWPEYQYAAVDLFTCGDTVDPWISFDFLKNVYHASNYSALEMNRGSLNLLTRIDYDIASLREQAARHINHEKFTRNVWFTDKDDDQALSLRYTGEILFDEQTEYQRVKVIDTYKYGKTLTIDNMVMCTEKDEFHYHEMISHPAMFAHGNVKNVLVIGGGDGGTVREVLKHDSVENVTMVEIDGAVVEASKKCMPTLSSAFDNPKLNLLIEDGLAYVKNSEKGIYDLIIVDGSDPIGPAEGLFSEDFYKDCYSALNENGILVAQGESPLFNEKAFVELNATLKKLFGEKNTKTLLFNVATYPTGLWSFQTTSKANLDITKVEKEIIDKKVTEYKLKYYNTGIHQASFVLPNYVKSMLNE